MRIEGVEYRNPILQIKFLKLFSSKGLLTPSDISKKIRRGYSSLPISTASITASSMMNAGLLNLVEEKGTRHYYGLTPKGKVVSKVISSYKINPYVKEPRLFQLSELVSKLPREVAETSIATIKRQVDQTGETPVFEKGRWLGFGVKAAIEKTGVKPEIQKPHKDTRHIFEMFRAADIDMATIPVDGILPRRRTLTRTRLHNEAAVLFGFGPQHMSSIICWDPNSCNEVIYPDDSPYALQLRDRHETLKRLRFVAYESQEKGIREFINDKEKGQKAIFVDRPVREMLMVAYPQLSELASRGVIDLVTVRHDVSPRLVKALLDRRGDIWQLVASEIWIFTQCMKWLNKIPEELPWLERTFPFLCE